MVGRIIYLFSGDGFTINYEERITGAGDHGSVGRPGSALRYVRIMNRIAILVVLWIFSLSSVAICSDEVNFTGTWVIDIRSKSERKLECGNAYFVLVQKGNRLCGDHSFATPGCGRLNEGYPGSVKGIVVGSTAVLVVTSGRNGAIVMGKATRKSNTLHWITLEEIKSEEPLGDSPLILGKGILKLDKSKSVDKELIDACRN